MDERAESKEEMDAPETEASSGMIAGVRVVEGLATGGEFFVSA